MAKKHRRATSWAGGVITIIGGIGFVVSGLSLIDGGGIAGRSLPLIGLLLSVLLVGIGNICEYLVHIREALEGRD